MKEIIKGVRIKLLKINEDSRGNFREILRESEGIASSIKQISMSKTKLGIIKAFHWHKYQDDLFYVVSGNLQLVLYDGREDSQTKGKTQVILLGEEYDPAVVFIPRGVLHGYKVIGNKDSEVLYLMNNEYNPIKPDEERVSPDDPAINFDWNAPHFVWRKKVLIIGASGLLGKQLMKDFSKDYEVVGTYNNSKREGLLHLDMTNRSEVESVISKENPDVIIVCSAKTNVEKCELEPEDTFRINLEGIRNIADYCKNRKIVYLSADSVFDGTKLEYTEEDAPNPINVYSLSKLRGEEVIQTLPDYLICRTARLYSYDKKSPKFINIMINSLREGKPIKAPIDTEGNPTFVPDLSRAIFELVKKDKKGVYHTVGDEAISFYRAALKIAEVFGFDSSLITPVEKHFFDTKVKRPTSILSINKLKSEGIKMSNFEEGLKKVRECHEKYQFVQKCRVCGHENLVSYLDLGETPLANALINKSETNSEEEQYPLNVVYCSECYFSQIDTIVHPDVLFKNYVYRSAISNYFQEHCEELAEELNDNGSIGKGQLIVDIASNDGTLLAKFKKRDNRILGIEPALNIADVANRDGIETISEYWTPAIARKIIDKYGHAKIITALNVFAHVNDIHSFVEGAKILLDKDGYLIIESPHLLKLIEKAEFDTVYHEHLSYLSVKPLKKLMEMHGLRLARIKEFDIHGGSIRLYIEHKEKKDTSDDSVHRIIAKEEAGGLYSPIAYTEFQKKVKKIKEELMTALFEIKKQGKTVAGFGASAKGNTLLNYCGIGPDIVKYIIDDTPEKQDKMTPGKRIPILSRETLIRDKPDYLLLLAWNFAKEIMEKTKDYKELGGRYIVPIPELKII